MADNKEYEIFREIDNGRGDLLLFVTRDEIGRLPFGLEKDCTQFSFILIYRIFFSSKYL